MGVNVQSNCWTGSILRSSPYDLLDWHWFLWRYFVIFKVSSRNEVVPSTSLLPQCWHLLDVNLTLLASDLGLMHQKYHCTVHKYIVRYISRRLMTLRGSSHFERWFTRCSCTTCATYPSSSHDMPMVWDSQDYWWQWGFLCTSISGMPPVAFPSIVHSWGRPSSPPSPATFRLRRWHKRCPRGSAAT